MKKELKIRFLEIDCWKCMESYNIYYVITNNKNISEDNKLIFNEKVISKIKEWNKNNNNILNFGEIKLRYSKTRDEEYMSFGCPKCDDWYLDEANV